MGVIKNIKDNLGDIFRGIKDVVTGKPSSPYSRDKAKNEAIFDKIANSPAPADKSGFTPDKDSSGKVNYNSPFNSGGSSSGGGRGGGSRGGGGSSSSASGAASSSASSTGASAPAPLSQTELRNRQLISSLRAREQITQETSETGVGLTRLQMQRRLKELGTNVGELREATRAGREYYKSTGENVFEKIKAEVKETRTPTPTPTPSVSTSNYVGNNIIFSSPEPDRTKQVYDSRTNMYFESPYGLGAGGTAIMTPPTLSEQAKIDEASYARSFENIKEKTKSGINWYKVNVVEPLSKSKAFRAYEEKVVKPLSSKIVQPTGQIIKSGIKAYEEKVVKPLRSALPSLGQSQIGQIAQAKRNINAYGDTQMIKVGLPGQIREVPAGQFKNMGLIEFGKEVYLGEVETAFTDIAKKSGADKPEYFGKAARYTSEFSAYAVPGYFELEFGGQLTEAASGGKFGGPKNVVQFVKEKPIEIAIAGTLGLAGGARYFSKGARDARKLAKYERYLKEPEKKAVALETSIREEVVQPNIVKPRLQYSIMEEFPKDYITPKTKGKLTYKQYIPESKQYGEVIELRTIGKKDKVFGGTAEISDKGIYREIINYDKNLVKITEGVPGEKGTVTLLKKGKQLLQVETDILKNEALSLKRPVVRKIKVNEQYGGAGIQIEQLGSRGKFIEKVSLQADEGGEAVTLVSDVKPSLKQTLVKSEIGTITIEGENVAAGIKQIVKEEKGFLDIIEVGPRKSLKKVKGKSGEIVSKRMLGQRIEEGVDKIPDLNIYIKKGNAQVLVRKISPKTKRALTEYSGQQSITIFNKPDVKLLEKTAKESKRLTRDVKMLNRIDARKQFDELVSALEESQLAKSAARKEVLSKKVSQLKSKLKQTTPKQSTSGPQLLESEYAYGQPKGPQVVLEEVTNVQPTEELLRLRGPTQAPTPPIIGDIVFPTQTKGYLPGFQTGMKDNQIRVEVDNNLIKEDTIGISSYSLIKEDVKPAIDLKILSISKINNRFSQPQKNKVLQDEKVLQEFKQQQKTLQESKVFQRLSDKSELNNLQQLSTKINKIQPKPKEEFKIKIPVKFSSSIKSIAKKAESGDLFKVFARKEGKDIEIGKAKTESEAFSLLKKKLTGTLRASGFVEKEGKKVKPLSLNGDFSISKADPFRIVEKKERRLRKTTTGKEIQYFRGSGSSKKKKKSLFGI